MKKVLIVGAGPAGLACAHKLSDAGYYTKVIDKRDHIGGMCSSFDINGFIFDRFVHYSFTQNSNVISIFNSSCNNNVREFQPNVYNLYNRNFIKHPVQNNLSSLGFLKGLTYLTSYLLRDKNNIHNYYDWLCSSYGKKFTDDFPLLYTLKYWCAHPKEMETLWIGPRMSNISMLDFLKSIFIKKENQKYYHKLQRYPLFGGYQTFLKSLEGNYEVSLNTELKAIDLKRKIAKTSNGDIKYDYIVYTAPLKELYQYIPGENSLRADCKKLHHTSGYMVSIGLNKQPTGKGYFFYIYDQDILFARAYYPHLKSPNNVPNGMYSIQLEYYTLDGRELQNPEYELHNSIENLLHKIGINIKDILFKDIKFEKYANILFDHNIYQARSKLYNYCKDHDIYLAGRYGKWDYLWSDQSVLSGLETADLVIRGV